MARQSSTRPEQPERTLVQTHPESAWVGPEMPVPGMRAPSDSPGDSVTQGYSAVSLFFALYMADNADWLIFVTAAAVSSHTHRALSVSVEKK